MPISNSDIQQLAKTIGKTIAHQRQLAKFTQEKVAEALGIGTEAVSRMERGIAIPTMTRLIELAALFNCRAADLLEQASNRPTEQALHLEKKLSKLDIKDREKIERWCLG